MYNMREKYSARLILAVTPSMLVDLEGVGGNRSGFVRSCIRQGILMHHSITRKVNSENGNPIAPGPGPEASPPA